MNINLRSDIYGPISFKSGITPKFADYLLPQADTYHADGPWGIICFQEMRTGRHLLRHFLFLLQNTLSFYTEEKDEGLQFLLNVKGQLRYKVGDLKEVTLLEKQYLLLDADRRQTATTVVGGKLCSLVNAYYTTDAYSDLLPLFPLFKKAVQKPYHLYYPAKVARYTVHDAVQAIWLDRYIDVLTKKHIELRLQTALFTLLAQTFTERPVEPISHLEQEKAAAARAIILRNIKTHLSSEQIASELHCSPPWLKKAFGKVYGMGMFHFLRRTRMEIAREMLLRGESLKAVAIEVGMKPRNFPKEFKSFFGYTVTALKKGLV